MTQSSTTHTRQRRVAVGPAAGQLVTQGEEECLGEYAPAAAQARGWRGLLQPPLGGVGTLPHDRLPDRRATGKCPRRACRWLERSVYLGGPARCSASRRSTSSLRHGPYSRLSIPLMASTMNWASP